MKKFTKVSLIVVAALAGVGILLCLIASRMGAGYGTMYRMALSGELDVGNWHIRPFSVYYSDDNGNASGTGVVTEGTEDAGGVSAGNSSVGFSAGEVRNLELEVDAAEIVFTEGTDSENIYVELENGFAKYYSCSLEGDTLKIEYDISNISYINGEAAGITIEMPKGMIFDELNLEIGAASVTFELTDVVCNLLMMDVGAGSVWAEGFEVKDKMEVDVGIGDVEIAGGTYEDVNLDCGMGSLSMAGKLNGNLEAYCGVGEIDLALRGKETDYNYDLSCGMGELEVNKTSYSGISGTREVINAGAVGTITLDCGMGSITLQIYESK